MGTYKFYIRQDENVYGPYSIDEVRNLGLLDDTEVKEASVNEWYPASYYDFDELYMKEHGYYVGDDGQIHRGTSTVHAYSDSQECPESVKGWSWGAFCFTWIWGIFNNVYWPLFMLLLAIIPVVGQIACFIITFYLGFKGREMAWENGNWRVEDVARFKSKQDSWSSAAGWLFVIWIVLVVIAIISASN